MPPYDDLKARLDHVWAEIRKSGGSDSIRIVAVTKTHPIEAVVAAAEAGLVDVGENYADELADKAVQADRLGLQVRWHYIGAIQSRRLRSICEHAAVIETVSRPRELEMMADFGYGGELLIQVAPPGHPEGRNGADASEIAGLLALGRDLGLNVVGLMGMAMPGSIESIRDYFETVFGLGTTLGLREYSMGMSADYQVAVAQGATMVRLGSVLFGARGQ
ncbi:alanine racemase [Ferrimicrobium acidiphilum]|uniref:alanine racemase n=1 Tax=Ferrimicrobium acidiphilum TaxID=121039 RepID=UPI0023F290C8|nr:alanine racemase [Ferrimicrobium acidiphilum]